MKRFYSLLSLIICINLTANIMEQKWQLDQIHKFADVLNIEGGTIAKNMCLNQKWFNIATVLDRPYIDGVEFDVMAKNKKFDFKETSILEYNELQSYYVHTTLIKYCIDHAHKICNKKGDEQVNIIVQVHRPKSGIKYIKILNSILNAIYNKFDDSYNLRIYRNSKINQDELKYKIAHNININFRYGSALNTLTDFECADIVISISLVAGFNTNFKSGDMVFPINFVPMDLDKMVLKSNDKYSVKNYFKEELETIIKSQDKEIIKIINEKFQSPNKDKKHLIAKEFSMKDFNEVTVLHVNKNFNPSLLPKEFLVI